MFRRDVARDVSETIGRTQDGRRERDWFRDILLKLVKISINFSLKIDNVTEWRLRSAGSGSESSSGTGSGSSTASGAGLGARGQQGVGQPSESSTSLSVSQKASGVGDQGFLTMDDNGGRAGSRTLGRVTVGGE